MMFRQTSVCKLLKNNVRVFRGLQWKLYQIIQVRTSISESPKKRKKEIVDIWGGFDKFAQFQTRRKKKCKQRWIYVEESNFSAPQSQIYLNVILPELACDVTKSRITAKVIWVSLILRLTFHLIWVSMTASDVHGKWIHFSELGATNWTCNNVWSGQH